MLFDGIVVGTLFKVLALGLCWAGLSTESGLLREVPLVTDVLLLTLLEDVVRASPGTTMLGGRLPGFRGRPATPYVPACGCGGIVQGEGS